MIINSFSIITFIKDHISNEYNLDINGRDIGIVTNRDDYFFADEHTVFDKFNRFKRINIRISKYDEKLIENSKLMKQKNLEPYFKSLSISDNEKYKATYIFIILHEFGHYTDMYKHKRHIYKYEEMLKAIQAINYTLAGAPKNDDNDQLVYMGTQAELTADVFAYRHFALIWNLLKSNKLI